MAPSPFKKFPPLPPLPGIPAPDSDLEERVEEVAPPKKRACPKGHETGVREIGCGRFMCSLCGRKWNDDAD